MPLRLNRHYRYHAVWNRRRQEGSLVGDVPNGGDLYSTRVRRLEANRSPSRFVSLLGWASDLGRRRDSVLSRTRSRSRRSTYPPETLNDKEDDGGLTKEPCAAGGLPGLDLRTFYSACSTESAPICVRHRFHGGLEVHCLCIDIKRPMAALL